MTDKFTLRDFLVYSFVGFTVFILVIIHFSEEAKTFQSEMSDLSDFALVLFIPTFYLVGHLIMGIDDILFNRLLSIPLRNKTYDNSNCIWKAYNWIFLSYRNNGIKWSLNINKDEFLRKCDEKIKDGTYSKAEYYQVISDLFKGVFLCIGISIILQLVFLVKFNQNLSILEGIALIVSWYRAKMFSAYYVKMVNRG